MHSKIARLTPKERLPSEVQEIQEEEADTRELMRHQLKEVVKNKRLEQQKAEEQLNKLKRRRVDSQREIIDVNDPIMASNYSLHRKINRVPQEHADYKLKLL